MHVAMLGATGAVGRTMLSVLGERRLPVDRLTLLASERSAGRSIDWGGRSWRCGVPRRGAFKEWTSRSSPPAATAPRSGARAPRTRARW